MKKNDEKNTAVKSAAKTSAAKKTAASSTVKTAAKTTKSTAKKTAAKANTKNVANTTAKKTTPTTKKTTRKPKLITIETICELVEKKIVKTKAAAIKNDVAVDIEVWGFEDGSNRKMYIEIKSGKVSVMPHTYEAKDFRVSLSFANAMGFANGKITLAKLLESKDFYAEGNIVSAIKLASIF